CGPRWRAARATRAGCGGAGSSGRRTITTGRARTTRSTGGIRARTPSRQSAAGRASRSNNVTQALATTIVVASLYALLAAGYVLVYRATRVLNLAQGDMMTLGGYFLFLVAAAVPGQPPLPNPTAAALSAAAGFPSYRPRMRPMA